MGLPCALPASARGHRAATQMHIQEMHHTLTVAPRKFPSTKTTMQEPEAIQQLYCNCTADSAVHGEIVFAQLPSSRVFRYTSVSSAVEAGQDTTA